VMYSISGTARNHKEPCQESRDPGEPAECHAWPGNPGSDVMNELGCCDDAAASLNLILVILATIQSRTFCHLV
jgi:hypothetical protein